MKTRWLMVGLAAVGLAAGLRAADDEPEKKDEPRPASGKKPSADEEAIRGVAESFTKAFNAGDARAVAALHTPDARVVDVTGEVVEGRDAVEREYAGLFRDNPGLTIEVNVDDLRLVGPDAAIEEGTTRVTPKDGGAPVVNRYSAVDVKRDGRVAPGERPRVCRAKPRRRTTGSASWNGCSASGSTSRTTRSSCRPAGGPTTSRR